ncbi:hypothetical protein M378DRAFT_174910 [Amanita muscaria Koide BX008]|uniref:Rad51-like C-terminal domain-containing protein n=1 Tax=Amanita muscaria (strain Koide BX008) TaxID=946122 RepID=A0A0C2XBB9_AMAMK|nr:hypothetical protein M378DRAFT_174910 [Amanita muscaria Koide BX008]
MPPRRAPSQISVTPSRAPSPPVQEEEVFFDLVDELQQHFVKGINMQDILKLKVACFLSPAAAINTVSGVNMTTRRQLLKIKGSSFATGFEVQDRRKRILIISTGSKSVDAMLGGLKIYRWDYVAITERRTGKTQLAHTMSVITQLPPELGGASGKVFQFSMATPNAEFIRYQCPKLVLHVIPHLSGTFRPDRIKSIAERFGVDGNMALENILYGALSGPAMWRFHPYSGLARAFNSEHQMELINECSIRFAEDKDFKLLVTLCAKMITNHDAVLDCR